MKFVLNGGLIIGTCDGANVSLSQVNDKLKETYSSVTPRSRLHVRSARRIYSYSEHSPKTWRTCVMCTHTESILLTQA